MMRSFSSQLQKLATFGRTKDKVVAAKDDQDDKDAVKDNKGKQQLVQWTAGANNRSASHRVNTRSCRPAE